MLKYGNKKSDLMQFSKKTAFFIVAFIPLWIIVIVNYALTKGSNANWYLIVGSSAFIVAVWIGVSSYLEKLRNDSEGSQTFKIVQKANITHDVIFYVLGYIPSILLTNFHLKEIITFAIVISIVYILYIKTNMMHINPILALMKYNMYKVTDDHDNTVVLLSKLNVKTGIDVSCNEITDNINIVLDSDG
ncbi:hypothetical protein [Candidatus Nitrosotalea okcheonensis]|nr:hypothetical protein [Candidatus Nitrosotalea okcheonensis]